MVEYFQFYCKLVGNHVLYFFSIFPYRIRNQRPQKHLTARNDKNELTLKKLGFKRLRGKGKMFTVMDLNYSLFSSIKEHFLFYEDRFLSPSEKYRLQ